MDPQGHVVLIHAFPLSVELWDPQRSALPPGWRLLTPDLPGFGGSTEPPAMSVDAMAASVLAAMDARGIRRAVIGGMSMGGYVTFALFRLAPERFSGLVLVDTRATADSAPQKEGRRKMMVTARERGSSAIADEMLPKLLGETSRRERPGVAITVRRLIEGNRPDAIAGAVEAMMGRPDSTALLSRMTMPALIVCGEEDTLTPPSDSEAMHRAIAGSRLVLLPRAGHLSSLESPEAFNAPFRAFLESQS
jgi:pimeloyl-ACP methyl ester carboxylesterase